MNKFLIIAFIVVLTQKQVLSQESNLKLLSFNIMCEFCHKKDADIYENRKQKIKEIIRNTDADIIALQELTRESQVEFLIDQEKYISVYYSNWLMAYPDAVLAIKKSRFNILKTQHYWLGPSEGRFSFGWKMALPRIFVMAKVKDLTTQREFNLISSHFDNRIENLLGSAHLINDIAKDEEIIFLADTNSTLEMESYKVLTKNLNDLAINFKGNREYCYLKKGKVFPDCRVDHILSNIEGIKSIDYKVITEKVNERFPSDHRPIYLEVSL
jgi:endonuclease/exonuclease/phosphatase family metal-dependent hydrolase